LKSREETTKLNIYSRIQTPKISSKNSLGSSLKNVSTLVSIIKRI